MHAYDYIVIDIETDILNTGDESVGDFKASPYNKDNGIVMVGAKHCDCTYGMVWGNQEQGYLPIRDLPVPNADTVLVGHNIAFDLAYLTRDSHEWDDWTADGKIWDTMIVEYLLSGQEDMFPSLDFCSAKVAGATLKDERIKEYWNAGINTRDIPHEELEEYLRADVTNCELVFLDQVRRATEMGMLELIHVQMEARLATMEMEKQGMFLSEVAMDEEQAILEGEMVKTMDQLKAALADSIPKQALDNIILTSPTTISAYLFGGAIKYKLREVEMDVMGQPVLFKSGAKKGLAKEKWVEYGVQVVGKFSTLPYTKMGKNGQYAVGEAVLNRIITDHDNLKLPRASYPSGYYTVKTILTLRGQTKDMSAYYVGYRKLRWPNGYLHPSFHHCATGTGRLSCSKPNLQQASGGSE